MITYLAFTSQGAAPSIKLYMTIFFKFCFSEDSQGIPHSNKFSFYVTDDGKPKDFNAGGNVLK